MNKMTKFWLATASVVHPAVSTERLVTLSQIQQKHLELFNETLPQSLEQQLISWKRRYADKNKPTRGGSRNRYLFRTADGYTPSSNGKFRLYKLSDSQHDGTDKTGPTNPGIEDVPPNFEYLVNWYLDAYQGVSPEIESESIEQRAEEEILGSNLPSTEKQSLINARRGQGTFRARVAEIENSCRLTGITDIRFLIASHIKPWSVSSNTERLDGNNGLLLAPHVDRLFDKGFITFKKDGSLVISAEAEDVCRCWNISTSSETPLSDEQEIYMRYHREHIFSQT